MALSGAPRAAKRLKGPFVPLHGRPISAVAAASVANSEGGGQGHCDPSR